MRIIFTTITKKGVTAVPKNKIQIIPYLTSHIFVSNKAAEIHQSYSLLQPVKRYPPLPFLLAQKKRETRQQGPFPPLYAEPAKYQTWSVRVVIQDSQKKLTEWECDPRPNHRQFSFPRAGCAPFAFTAYPPSISPEMFPENMYSHKIILST